MDVKVGFLSKDEKNPRGILYRPNPQKESGTALHVSNFINVVWYFSNVKNRLHLLFA